MNGFPKVSAILVNYNNYADTIDCISALRSIEYKNIKIIIVDNSSTNNSIEELRKVINPSNEILILSDRNGGFSAGNNIGIRYALEHGSDYILLLNNDTVVKKDFLNVLVSTSEEYKRNAVVTPKIFYFYDKSKLWYAGGTFNKVTGRITHIGINDIDNDKYNLRRKVDFASGCCMLIPANIIKNVGMMDERFFLYCEDVAYCREIYQKGYDLIYEPNAIIFHKVNASTSKEKDSAVFYTVRNRLYINRLYIKAYYRIISNMYYLLECTKRIVFGEYSIKAVRRGIKDYMKDTAGILVNTDSHLKF